MKTKGINTAVTSGILASLAASSCCIPPVIAAIAGVGGISSGLSWIEPLRPYLIGLAVLAIGYAWYAHLRPRPKDDCGCEIETRPKFFQKRSFLWMVSIVSAASISFPAYAHLLTGSQIEVGEEQRSGLSITVKVAGMSCESCERHVVNAAHGIEAVHKATASYKSGTATIDYDTTRTDLASIISAIEKTTGYTLVP